MLNKMKLGQNGFLVFSLFFMLALLIYLPGSGGRFTSDFYNWVYIYETSNLSDLWTCFGYPGLHQMYHIPFYLCYKLFSLNELSWSLVFILLHSTNAFLIFRFSEKIFQIVNKKGYWPIFTGLLFLLSPFQTETVAWGATIHYLVMTFFIMNSFIQLIDYLTSKSIKNLILFYIFYSVGLLTMELPLVFPAIFVGFALFSRKHFNIELNEILIKLTLPFVLIIFIYFATSKLIFHSFIGHYGAEKHLNLNINLLINTLYGYFLKYICFYRYIPINTIKEVLLLLYLSKIFQALTFIPLSIYGVRKLFLRPSEKISKISIVFLMLIFFSISLLPVLNIDMSSNIFLQTDRYSYLGSIFFLLAISLLLSIIKGKSVLYISAIYLLINMSLTIKDVLIWKEVGELKNKMIYTYNSKNKEVFTLNLIDTHKGAYVFRNGFRAALKLERNIDIEEDFHPLMSINTTTINDSITYSIKNDTLHVEAMKWGRWFWRNGAGASNFENDQFKMNLGFMGVSYDLINKTKKETTYIFFNGNEWKEIIQP